ncbi:glucosyl-3-phosphoglycerate synthase [Pseudanabaena sp. FACHB-2040]|uniref:glucosyl-3-phosphoglycerate synthase n=1 Tax=Pseudanabaena sp. FACHB-2040 TaxID=2692859 RepID=UPI001686BE80|nr:glucosyl-3-phosphoglycerate synthase [Pseudanabaena sp. FACHB-2040]MBD2260772.1 glucosyl-3-phosphoglycerate synthase [Pseudanabaena sp. FACHB-2040]
MDYKQELITTIHDLGCDLEQLEARLTELSQTQPTAVLIPSLYEELERPALTLIRDQLSQCAFVNNVVICLYADTWEQYVKAVQFFEPLPQPTFVLWENGPRITQILQDLQERGLDLLQFRGKGRAVWMGLGVATLDAVAIALHDADITTYDRSYPLKLLYPILEREFGIAFSKAYYARLGETPRSMHGRVTRLFVTPLVTSLMELFGYRDYLRYLDAYRYPLSGEFALTSDLALTTRIPANWGLEVGLLAEVYRNVALKRVAQVDLGLFEHKHQAIGTAVDQGLQKMCRDILQSILRTLTETEQVVIGPDHIRALRVKYRREAQNLARQFFVDARFNNLVYDRHAEEVTLECFERVILHSGEQYLNDPTGTQIPDWTRALAVIPNLREQIQDAAISDMADARAALAGHSQPATVTLSLS